MKATYFDLNDNAKKLAQKIAHLLNEQEDVIDVEEQINILKICANDLGIAYKNELHEGSK